MMAIIRVLGTANTSETLLLCTRTSIYYPRTAFTGISNVEKIPSIGAVRALVLNRSQYCKLKHLGMSSRYSLARERTKQRSKKE
jgi:hypothetical protein